MPGLTKRESRSQLASLGGFREPTHRVTSVYGGGGGCGGRVGWEEYGWAMGIFVAVETVAK